MWKFVTRRLKETFERTCNNVLDVGKNWKFGGSSVQQTSVSQDIKDEDSCEELKINEKCVRIFPNVYICSVSHGKTSNGSSDGGQNEKKGKRFRDDSQNGIHNDLLGAITWSGAIVCGWYASQLLCLNQRRRYGWSQNNYGCYLNVINAPARAIHSNILSHLALTSPVQPSLLTEKTLKKNFSFDPKEFVKTKNEKQSFNIVEVSNENDTPSSSGASSLNSSKSSQKQTVTEAVDDLVKFLGETEFKLGIKYISAGHYRSAVRHLKLASRHNHVGATFNLGLCYEQGLGVSKNLKRAMECYQHASSMGHSKAIYNLGVFYAKGLGGLEKDHEAARQCFIAAAKLGQNEAKQALGWSAEAIIDQKEIYNMSYLTNEMTKKMIETEDNLHQLNIM